MKRFCFTDSSGVLASDRFFGTGLLVVGNVGDLGDKLSKNAQSAKALRIEQKNKQLAILEAQGRRTEAVNILRASKHFEMKFDHVGNLSLQPYYERMFDIFLADPDNRFSVMVVDKQRPGFDHAAVEDAWETYTKYVAQLVVQEMKNLNGDELCLVVDEISKPRNKPLSLEDTIMSKVREEVIKESGLDFNRVFGAFSIESHSNLPMQLCDTLLGAVMYDYKKVYGLATPKTQAKKEVFVKKIRDTFGITTLAAEFTHSGGVYFDVSQCA